MSGGTMSFTRGILSLTILLNILVSGSLGETLRVTCSPQTICALRESTVNLDCFYSNSNIKPQHSFWFSPKQKAKWRNEEDPEDLALDSDYAGRVSYDKTTTYSYSYDTLTITDLRERDSGEYHLMIIKETGQNYSSSTAVTLTVSDLQMKTADTEKQTARTLNCSTSCRLSSVPAHYRWYNNGKYVSWTNSHNTILDLQRRASPGSYSCSVSSHTEIYSNTVCVFDKNCWSVTYSDRRVCALEGSSVDFPCTYSYPRDQTVTETFWYNFGLTDLSVKKQFAGRVEFLGDKERSCTLRMNNLTKSDSGEYRFRLITDTAGGSFSGYPGVILSVTDLQVKVSPSTPSEGQTVTLTCISTCTLTQQPHLHLLYLESANTEDVLQYSCALGGTEAPKHTEDPEDLTVLKFITIGAAVFLVLFLIIGWIWRRRRKSSPGKEHRSTEESGQCDSAHVYSNISELAMTSDPTQRKGSDNQDGVHYSSVQFKRFHKQEEAPPSTSTLPLYVIEDQDVQYAAVNFSRESAAPQ
ncbi:uncharacterized protein LOC118826840 [Colossoma macropomum]|uniref:uncharacterized protein LOC118826840 n=1 Tax=Colossoma macropomum TaxID=42526 RepID=UPI0018654FFA|nr:uncharacterized protein LOC118826840 [Colossoma macropomum]